MFLILKAFCIGFIEGKGEMGLTWDDPNLYHLNECYDWGRSLRRMSRTN